MAFRSLAADDIFISYTRLDASTYAAGLAEELTKRGFSCFIDKLGTEPNKDLPDPLRRKIRSCAMLVIVGTKRAAERPTIHEEVTEFIQTGRRTLIVPIDFGGAVYDATWYPLVEGVAPEPEKNPEALDDGVPSPSVVSRIEKQFTYARRNQRLRRATLATAALLTLLLLASAVAGVYAAQQLGRAEAARVEAADERRKANEARDAAEDARKVADAERKTALAAKAEADAAKDDAREQKGLAERATKEAEAKTRLADAAARRADAASARAAEQQARADREQTVADARSLANRSQALLRRRPEALPRAVSYAAEAVEKASAIKVRSVEADAALREALALLPRFESAVNYDGDITAVALSPDARHLATITAKALRVYEVGSRTPLYEQPCDGHLVALSNGGTRAAVAGPRSVRVHDLKAGTSRDLAGLRGRNFAVAEPPPRDENDLEFKGLALSPGGRYLAITQENAMQPHTYGLVVWDAERDSQVASFLPYPDMVINDVAFGPRGDLAAGGYATGPQGRWIGKVHLWPLREHVADDWETNGGLTAKHFERPLVSYHPEQINSIAAGLRRDYFAADGVVWQTTGPEFAPAARALPSGRLEEMAFTSDGRELLVVTSLPRPDGKIVFGLGPKRVERWGANGYREEVRVNIRDVKRAGFLPGGEAAVADPASETGVRLFRVPGGAEVTEQRADANRESLVHVSPNARFTVERVGRGVRVRDAWRREVLEVSAVPELEKVWVAALDDDGDHLALAGAVGGGASPPSLALVYKRAGGSYAEAGRVRLAAVPGELGLSSGGRHLLARAADLARVYEVAGGSDVTPAGLGKLYHESGSARFSPDGRYLAAVSGGDDDYTFRAWRVSDGRELKGSAPLRNSTSFAFSPGGRFLFVAGWGGTARLLELSSGRATDVSFDAKATAVAFSADGSYVAVGDEDGSARLYHLSDLENEVALLPNYGKVTAVAFSADDRYLLTASEMFDPYTPVAEQNHQVRVWLLNPADLLAEARRRLERLPGRTR